MRIATNQNNLINKADTIEHQALNHTNENSQEVLYWKSFKKTKFKTQAKQYIQTSV